MDDKDDERGEPGFRRDVRKAADGKSDANRRQPRIRRRETWQVQSDRSAKFPDYARNVTRFWRRTVLCSVAKSHRAKFETFGKERKSSSEPLLPLGVVNAAIS